MNLLTLESVPALQTEIRTLAAVHRAVILAHNYQRPEVQDVADFVGDSLGLSRKAAAVEGDAIVFCGVHFMAETAKILAPTKRVLLPDLAAGCSLADTITADEVRGWRKQFPDYSASGVRQHHRCSEGRDSTTAAPRQRRRRRRAIPEHRGI